MDVVYTSKDTVRQARLLWRNKKHQEGNKAKGEQRGSLCMGAWVLAAFTAAAAAGLTYFSEIFSGSTFMPNFCMRRRS
jgi:hypothetical protein